MKAARDKTKWTNREIEADSVGYRAAQEAYKADQDRRIRELEDALATKAGAKRCAVVWVLGAGCGGWRPWPRGRR